MVAAQAILSVFASCTLASAQEGINWKNIFLPSKTLPQEPYSRRQIIDAWEKITYVLNEARKNETFPGTLQNLKA